jgi:hypothetical protein
MSVLIAAVPAKLLPAFWGFMIIVAALGLLAVCSPTRFTSLALRGGRWIDSSKFLSKFDQRFDLDEHVLPHARWLGAAVIAAVVMLMWVTLHG